MEKLKLSFKIFFLGLLGLALFLLVIAKRQQNDQRVFSAVFDSVSPVQSSAPQPIIETGKMDSPDGTKTLKMKKTIWPDKINYEVFTSEADRANELLIINRETDTNTRIEIPFNTWSPDNTYFFLKEASPAGTGYLVFSASGEVFSEDKKQLNVKELFLAKYPEYTITDVTGWATISNLLVNTVLGEEKISFWFTVKNQAFTKLSTFFD